MSKAAAGAAGGATGGQDPKNVQVATLLKYPPVIQSAVGYYVAKVSFCFYSLARIYILIWVLEMLFVVYAGHVSIQTMKKKKEKKKGEKRKCIYIYYQYCTNQGG